MKKKTICNSNNSNNLNKFSNNPNKFSINFNKFFEKGNSFQKKAKKDNFKNGNIKKRRESLQDRKTMECWSYGKIGHYRSKCPQEKGD